MSEAELGATFDRSRGRVWLTRSGLPYTDTTKEGAMRLAESIRAAVDSDDDSTPALGSRRREPEKPEALAAFEAFSGDMVHGEACPAKHAEIRATARMDGRTLCTCGLRRLVEAISALGEAA